MAVPYPGGRWASRTLTERRQDVAKKAEPLSVEVPTPDRQSVLITIVAVINGTSVKGGAEGVGRVTTAAVVHGISAIVITDMIFVFASTA